MKELVSGEGNALIGLINSELTARGCFLKMQTDVQASPERSSDGARPRQEKKLCMIKLNITFI